MTALARRSTIAALLLAAAVTGGGCASGGGGRAGGAGEGPEFLLVSERSPGPFSPAVRAGNLLFLSGQIGTDATGAVVKGGIEAETRQTMQNIAAVLQGVGSSMERVVKCTVFMADMREWPAMNAVYTTFFPTNKPARSAAGANGLALGARVEIECIALAGRA